MFEKKNYVVYIKSLKLALDYGLTLEKVHKVLEFSQEAWLKHYIDMNTEFRKRVKNNFEKDFFKQTNNFEFGKTMENMRNHSDINLVMTDEKRNKLASDTNYHTTKHFSAKLLAIKMKEKNITKQNKSNNE